MTSVLGEVWGGHWLATDSTAVLLSARTYSVSVVMVPMALATVETMIDGVVLQGGILLLSPLSCVTP